MKKLIPTLLTVAAVATMAVAPVNAAFGKKLTAEYGTPKLDGVIDSAWKDCETTIVDRTGAHKAAARESDSKDTATVRVLWDEVGLYFLVEAKDAKMVPGKETFEFYFDETHDKSTKYSPFDRQTRVIVDTGEVPANSTKDTDGKPNERKELFIGSGYQATADGWVLEVGFKWVDAAAIKADKVIGLELAWDNQGDPAYFFRWNVDSVAGDPAPFTNPSCFGDLKLNKKAAPAAKPAAAAKTGDPITVACVAVAAATLGAGVTVSKKKK